MIKVGDKAKGAPEDLGEAAKYHPHYEGTVVYIHPLRRFYTVEWVFENGRYRETRYFYPRCGSNTRA